LKSQPTNHQDGLYPIKIASEHFFAISAGIFWIMFLVPMSLGQCSSDLLINICILGGIQCALVVLLLLYFYRSERWPFINPIKPRFINSIVQAIIGEIQLLPFLYIFDILWYKVLTLLQRSLHFDLKEQALVGLLRSELSNGTQLCTVIIFTVIIVPIEEEIVFRYFLYRFGKSHMSPFKAMLCTSAAFALLHFNLSASMPLFFMGMFLVWLYERCGHLTPCIIVHGMYNYIAVLSTLLLPKEISL
jgi:membrane protease YdiL (CAAX protease family)